MEINNAINHKLRDLYLYNAEKVIKQYISLNHYNIIIIILIYIFT